VDRAYMAFDLMLQGLRTEINAPVEPLMPARLPEPRSAASTSFATAAPVKEEPRPTESEPHPHILAV